MYPVTKVNNLLFNQMTSCPLSLRSAVFTLGFFRLTVLQKKKLPDIQEASTNTNSTQMTPLLMDLH